MADVSKIDSNVTGLAFAEEDTFGVLPVTPVWYPLEPNSYNDFGGQLARVARAPITAGRQRKKGVVTDLDASGGFNTDLTQTNLQRLLQGFFFADLRPKDEYGDGSGIIIAVGASNDIQGTDIDHGVVAGQLIFCSGFTNSANNGLKKVASVASGSVTTTETLVAEAAPPAAAKFVTVGVQAGAGDLDVTTSGAFATITSTTLDFTTLGLIPGEWIYVGGDSAGLGFAAAANNGFKRIRSIAAHALVLDKSALAMSTEASTTETVQLFFGRVLKNETGTSIVRRSYNLERQLGAPDDADPTDIQAEYLAGSVPNELTFVVPTSGKLNCDLSFISGDHETVDGATGPKTGTRVALVESDAFNSSSDVVRIKMAVVDAASEAPTALFGFLTELKLSINNNVSPDKAIGVLGAFDVSVGDFEVGGEVTAYFSDVAAIAAVRANSDITLDIILARANTGIVIDLPLVALGDGRLNIEKDKAVTLPLSLEAATGAKVLSTMDHTLLMQWFDYLPTAAM